MYIHRGAWTHEYTCLQRHKVDVKNYPLSFFHLIVWGRVSQSNSALSTLYLVLLCLRGFSLWKQDLHICYNTHGHCLKFCEPNLRSSASEICNLTTGQYSLAYNNASYCVILLSKFMDEKNEVLKRYKMCPRPNDYQRWTIFYSKRALILWTYCSQVLVYKKVQFMNFINRFLNFILKESYSISL